MFLHYVTFGYFLGYFPSDIEYFPSGFMKKMNELEFLQSFPYPLRYNILDKGLNLITSTLTVCCFSTWTTNTFNLCLIFLDSVVFKEEVKDKLDSNLFLIVCCSKKLQNKYLLVFYTVFINNITNNEYKRVHGCHNLQRVYSLISIV